MCLTDCVAVLTSILRGGNDDVTSSVALADTPTGEGNRMLQQVHRAAHRTSMANQKSSPCQFKVVSV